MYEQRPFYVLNRELSGIQALKDSYSAKGEEYQSEFITDLQTQIDTIKKNTGVNVKDYVNDYVGDYTYDKGTIDDMFANFEGGGGSKIISVEKLPADHIDPDAYYAIQGIVVVE